MSSSVIQGFFPGGRPQVRGPVSHGTIQRSSTGNAVAVPGDILRPRIPGRPLPVAVQRKMEGILAADFSGVRIHVGPQAGLLGALAFTHGSDIYFAPGQYDPSTTAGQRLLAHELTHVVQQRAGRVRNPFGSGVAVVQDSILEAEAERTSVRLGMERTPVPPPAPRHAVQRATAPARPANVSRILPVPVLQPRMVSRGAVIQLQRQLLKVPVPLPPIPLPVPGKGKEVMEEAEELRIRRDKLTRLVGLFDYGREHVLPQLSEIHGDLEYDMARKAAWYGERLRNILRVVKNWLGENASKTKHGLESVPDVPLELVQELTETVAGIMGELNDSYRKFREYFPKPSTTTYSNVSNSNVEEVPHIIGLPPSTWSKIGPGLKYEDLEAYQVAKALKQSTRSHVPLNTVKSTLKNTSGGAENVEVVVKIHTDIKQVITRLKADTSCSHLFTTPFSQHNHEIDISKGDGEVIVLSGAYLLCKADFDTHQHCQVERTHHVGLVGPYGPCDGCKERIKKFKSEWLKLARTANCSSVLIVTYFYRHTASRFRNDSTLYGNLDAQPGNEPSLPQLDKNSAPKGSYWYRSTEARYQYDKAKEEKG